MPLSIDVVIPTYNRSVLLEKAVRSLLAAPVPEGLIRRILVVDNNSTDSTASTLTRLGEANPGVVLAIRERQQGRSAALNAGIRAASAELIGFIDDDETVSPEWYSAVFAAMGDSDLDFIGGPVVGEWEVAPPPWLPAGLPGVLGLVDGGREIRPFDADYPGILMGGNCVIRRGVFDKVGLYSTELGRTSSGLLSGEDHDLYLRLLGAGMRGSYRPDLEIRHFIPRNRVTRKYFRSWCFWHGVSMGSWSRTHREPVPHLGGIPRYNFGAALRGMMAMLNRSPGERFGGELELWNLAGMLYGRHFAGRKKPSGPS